MNPTRPAAEADLRAAFEAWLGRAAPARLAALAASKKLRGLRPNAPAPALRAALAATFGPRLRTWDEALGDCLRETDPTAALVAAVATAALEALGPALMAAACPPAAFLLACLQDARPAVQRLGRRWLDEGLPGPLPDAAHAQATLARVFLPVRGDGAAQAPAAEADLLRRLADLKQRLEDEKAAHKKTRREAEEAARKAGREAQAALATADFNVGELTKRVGELEARLAKAEAEREARVARAVAARLPQAFHGWLAPAVAAEALAQADPAAPLLARAEQALKDQARYDRASAARARLAERLAEVEAMLRRVDGALAGAQARLPALVDVRGELAARREELRQGLRAEGAEPACGVVAAQLRAAIQASRERQQPELEGLLGAALRFHLIDGAEREALGRALARRQALWGIEAPPDKDAAAEAGPLDPSATVARRNPALAQGLRGAARLYLFLDGHNILNGLRRYRVPRGVPLAHEAARKRVEEDVCRLLAGLPLVVGTLVWDGETRSDCTKSDNFSVRYSGGVGEHRADNYILQELAFHRHDGVPMVVVTNDNAFRGQAERLGAKACPLSDFEAFLTYALH